MTKIIAVSVSVIILLTIIELIREEKLTFKYAFGWICLSLLAITFSIFDKSLISISTFLGFELPSNFIFFTAITCLVFLSLLMTLFLCQQSNHNHDIAQKIGILEYDIEELKKETEKLLKEKNSNESTFNS